VFAEFFDYLLEVSYFLGSEVFTATYQEHEETVCEHHVERKMYQMEKWHRAGISGA